MRVYLAARYGRREELLAYRQDLESVGIEVTAHWLGGPSQRLLSGAVLTPEQEAIIESDLASPTATTLGGMCAMQDVRDVQGADVVVSFTENLKSSTRGRGGRHVEFGLGWALGKTMMLVGDPEHVFHCLPDVRRYGSWGECFAALAGEHVHA